MRLKTSLVLNTLATIQMLATKFLNHLHRRNELFLNCIGSYNITTKDDQIWGRNMKGRGDL